MIVLILGSKSDLDWAKKIEKEMNVFGIPSVIRIASAHKTPEYLLKIIQAYKKPGVNTVFIAIAGRSNALGGFIDANCYFPVINCPPPSDKYGGLDILSSLRMPSGVAPATVLEADQAALLAAKILALSDKKLAAKIVTYQKKLRENIVEADKSLKK